MDYHATLPLRSARQSLSWTVFQALSQILSRLLALVVLSWLLPPTVFGYYGVAMSAVMILSTFAQMGIPTNLICLDEVGSKSLVAAVLAGLVVSATVTLAYLIAISVMQERIGGELSAVLVALSFYIPVQVLLNTLEAFGRRLFAFKALAICDLAAATFGNLILAVALAYHGWGVWALVAGQVVGALIQAAGLLFACRDFLGFRTNIAELRRIVSSSFSLTIAEAANIITVYAQRPLVGAVLGAAAAGLWTRFYQIILLQLTCLVQPIDKLVMPTLSRHRASMDRTRETTLLTIEIVSLVTIPVSAITAGIAPFAIELAFGPAWTELVLPMQIASITLFIRGVDRILLSAARAAGHIRSRAVVQVLQMVVVIGAIYWAAPHGLPMIAGAYVVSQSCGLVAMLVLFSRNSVIPLRRILERILPGAVCGAVMLGVTAAIEAIGKGPTSGYAMISLWLALTVSSAFVAWITYQRCTSAGLRAQLNGFLRHLTLKGGPAA
ncbi:oligosaccharide flippase family protein [Neorhizobium sp. BT27B]|uniref:oligosaccharide flippase family protein n=1 Tax=Neorhizobium sp. BT27B TaxID=3142625 RepID=UPI003D26D378